MRLPDDIEFSTEPEDLLCYGYDASGLEGEPSAVAWPGSAEDVLKVLKYASEKGVPVVPRGAGSGLTGGAVPSKGAIVLSFEKMNRIIEVDGENLNAVVEPGLINSALQRALEPQGFFYPPDPSSMDFCTIGGNVAEDAGGPRALKYGVTRDYVMEIEAVLPTGESIRTGYRTRKGVVGYDLTRLLVGSEGTLGVFTKIRLRILPRPEAVITLLAQFDGAEAAGGAVSSIISTGIIPRTLELMDGGTISAVERYKPIGLPSYAGALLLIELDGRTEAITKEAQRVAEACERNGGTVKMASDQTARERLWESRRAVSPALYRLSPGKINEDIVVPPSRLPGMLGTLRRISERSGIKIVSFGHAGDGNIHVNLMVDNEDAGEFKKARGLVREIFGAVIEMGGSISGEHGVGLTKAPYIGMELGERQLELMRGLKRLFDPREILNPGKIFK